MLLGGWAALSLIRSSALSLSLNALAALFAALLLGGLAARLARDPNGFLVLLLTIITAGSLVAGMGINEYLGMLKLGVPFYRIFSTFANPDFLAAYLLLTLPLTLAAFAAATQRTARLVFGVFLALQSAALLLTGSRAGVGILLVALIAWVVLSLLAGAAKGYGKSMATGFAIFGITALLASAPTFSRIGLNAPKGTIGNSNLALKAAMQPESQGHSAAFRRYTWIGTMSMARANPILGTGLGTFEVSYPRYATTAFTRHAHNGYLQWMGDTGFPGLLFLLAALAAGTAFATHVLLLRRRQQAEEGADTIALPLQTPPNALFGEPRLLLAGLLAAALASLMHGIIDSDWYIVAIAMTFSAVIALLVGLARDIAPLATQKPLPLSRGFLAFAGVIALFTLWRAVALGTAQVQLAAGSAAMREMSGANALAAQRAANAADPFDPEPYLDSALIYQAMQSQEELSKALKALENAVRVAPTGRAYYRLAQFYARQNQPDKAMDAFEKAREREPHNVQNLKAYADTARKAGKTDKAASLYREITLLETQPYGTVRAMPHRVETDFAYAHIGLAEIAAEAGRWDIAARESASAAATLREFWLWFKLDPDISQTTPTERQDTLEALTEQNFARWQEALQKQGAGSSAEQAKVAEELAAFRKDRADYKAELQKAQASQESGASQ